MGLGWCDNGIGGVFGVVFGVRVMGRWDDGIGVLFGVVFGVVFEVVFGVMGLGLG